MLGKNFVAPEMTPRERDFTFERGRVFLDYKNKELDQIFVEMTGVSNIPFLTHALLFLVAILYALASLMFYISWLVDQRGDGRVTRLSMNSIAANPKLLIGMSHMLTSMTVTLGYVLGSRYPIHVSIDISIIVSAIPPLVIYTILSNLCMTGENYWIITSLLTPITHTNIFGMTIGAYYFKRRLSIIYGQTLCLIGVFIPNVLYPTDVAVDTGNTVMIMVLVVTTLIPIPIGWFGLLSFKRNFETMCDSKKIRAEIDMKNTQLQVILQMVLPFSVRHDFVKVLTSKPREPEIETTIEDDIEDIITISNVAGPVSSLQDLMFGKKQNIKDEYDDVFFESSGMVDVLVVSVMNAVHSNHNIRVAVLTEAFVMVCGICEMAGLDRYGSLGNNIIFGSPTNIHTNIVETCADICLRFNEETSKSKNTCTSRVKLKFGTARGRVIRGIVDNGEARYDPFGSPIEAAMQATQKAFDWQIYMDDSIRQPGQCSKTNLAPKSEMIMYRLLTGPSTFSDHVLDRGKSDDSVGKMTILDTQNEASVFKKAMDVRPVTLRDLLIDRDPETQSKSDKLDLKYESMYMGSRSKSLINVMIFPLACDVVIMIVSCIQDFAKPEIPHCIENNLQSSACYSEVANTSDLATLMLSIISIVALVMIKVAMKGSEFKSTSTRPNIRSIAWIIHNRKSIALWLSPYVVTLVPVVVSVVFQSINYSTVVDSSCSGLVMTIFMLSSIQVPPYVLFVVVIIFQLVMIPAHIRLYGVPGLVFNSLCVSFVHIGHFMSDQSHRAHDLSMIVKDRVADLKSHEQIMTDVISKIVPNRIVSHFIENTNTGTYIEYHSGIPFIIASLSESTSKLWRSSTKSQFKEAAIGLTRKLRKIDSICASSNCSRVKMFSGYVVITGNPGINIDSLVEAGMKIGTETGAKVSVGIGKVYQVGIALRNNFVCDIFGHEVELSLSSLLSLNSNIFVSDRVKMSISSSLSSKIGGNTTKGFLDETVDDVSGSDSESLD